MSQEKYSTQKEREKKKKRRKCAKPSGGASMKEPRKCLAEEKGKDQWSSWKRTSGCLVRLVRQG